VLLAALAATDATRATACSICLAGDPVFSAQGTSAQEPGSFSIFVETRGWEKKSGLLPHEEPAGGDLGGGGRELEKNRSQRLDLYVSWTPIDRLTLTLDVPWAFNEIKEIEGDSSTTSTLSSLGDISLQASAVLWRNRDVLPTTWVEGRAFLKTPSGKDSQRVDGVKDPHLQVGTGSWDYGFGLAFVHKLERAVLFASAFYRINSAGALHYEYGDNFLANMGLRVPLGHATGIRTLERFTPGFELNYRWAAKDETEGDRFGDSGGSILYLAPSLDTRIPWFDDNPPSLRIGVQIPATNSGLNGFQREDPIWSAGILYSF